MRSRYSKSRGVKRARKSTKKVFKRSYRARTRKHYSKKSYGSNATSVYSSYKKPSYAVKVLKNVAASDYIYNSYFARVESSIGYSTPSAVSLLGGGAYTGSGGGFDSDMAQIIYRIQGGVSGNDVKKTTRFVVESVKAQMQFTNQDNGPVNIRIFDIVSKRDHNYSPQEAFRAGLANQSATAFTLATMPPGVLPTMSLEFNNYFKVKGTKTITLEQGKTHLHNITLQPNRVVNAELLKQSNLNIAGLTHWVLFVVTGCVVNSVTNPDTEVSVGAAAVDVSLIKTMRYTFCQDNTSNFFVNTNPPTSLTGGESILNIGTGTATVEVQA